MDALQARLAFQRTLYVAAGMGLVAGGLLSAWRAPVGWGFMLGCGAGIAAYLWIARLLSKMGDIPAQELALHSTRQAMARLGMYAVAFALAFRLDREHYSGIAGALGGYLFVRVVLTFHAWRNTRA
jgi:hypothetical protein